MYTDTTFCSVRVSSAQGQIHVEIEQTNCSDHSSRSRILNSFCGTRDNCNSAVRFLQTCLNTTQVQSRCQISPTTVTEPPITPALPTTINKDCPTTPTNGPTSSMSTLNTESQTKLSSQISKLTDERDSLMVAVVSLGALVGMLVILLAVVTSGWVWTCWTMKRNKATTSSEHVRYNLKR